MSQVFIYIVVKYMTWNSALKPGLKVVEIFIF